MIHPKHHHSVAVVVLVGVILLFLLLFFTIFPNSNKDASLLNGQRQMYHSDFLNISFAVPNNYLVKELHNFITVTNNDSEEIEISRIGTNSDSLEDYLYSIDQTSNKIYAGQEIFVINGFPVVRIGTNDKRYYLFYKKNFVYSISTTAPDLYDELDQVAQSFKYIPPENSQN